MTRRTRMTYRNVSIMLALAGLVAGCSAKNPAVPQGGTDAPSAGRAPSPASEVGARIYSGNCVPCHQQGGAGIPGVYPSLVGSPVVLGDPAELARWVIK